MKKLFTLSFILFSFFAKADYWTQKANFPGLGRGVPFSFSIGNKGYIGGGYTYSTISGSNDFWEYDPSLNAWTQKADFGGIARYASTAFSIGNMGYAGLGANLSPGVITMYKDFWQYNPLTNSWIQKADYGGDSTGFAVGFSWSGKGYICTGLFVDAFQVYHYKNDLWEYDPGLDVWTQKSSLPPGSGRSDAVAFSANGMGYIGTGWDGTPKSDFWQYDIGLDSWSQIADLPGNVRCDATAFSICDKGYAGTGENQIGSYYNDIWQYDAVANQWIQKTSFGGSVRDEVFSFTIGTKAYTGLGGHNGIPTYNDFWEYTPDSACTTGIEELTTTDLEFTITPNPVKEYITLYIPNLKDLEYITITDAQGKKVYETKLLTSNLKLQTSNFSKGIYFVEATNGKQKAIKKFVKE